MADSENSDNPVGDDQGDTSAPFLELVFANGRMEGHALPLSLLRELVDIQKLFEGVARHVIKNVLEAERVPYGFMKAAQLQLTQTRHNCFAVSLDVPDASHGHEVAIEKTREVLLAALTNMEQGAALPPEFPDEEKKRISNVGRNLEGPEEIRFRYIRGESQTRATVSQASRQSFATLQSLPQTVEETIEGEITSVSGNHCRIKVETRSYDVEFNDTDTQIVKATFADSPASLLHVTGSVLVHGTQRRMSAEDILVIGHPRADEIGEVRRRIDELGGAAAGWLDGEGKEPDPESLKKCERVLSRLLADYPEIPAPGVFLAPDGNLQAEWLFEDLAVEVRFDATRGRLMTEASRAVGPADQNTFGSGEVSGDNASQLASWLSQLEGWRNT